MQQFRIDKNPLPKVYRTSEGYIKGTAIVTRTGIFKYVDNQGNIRLELRHPEDVLEEDSLESLKQIPITVEHPTVLVDSSNVKQLGVGLTGETVKIDGENIKTTVTITAIEGVEAINSGKEELSLGYTLDLEEEEGIYNGQPYTHRQKNIRYNHLAIVERGRAGANARLNFDSFECGMIVDENIIHERENMVKINIDNVDVEVNEAVKKAYDSLNARLDSATAETEALKAKLDEKEEELKKAKEINSDSAISEKAKARVELIAKAGKVVNIDGLYDLSDREIKLSVIKSRYDSLDLTDKSDDYVSARFDAICEALTNNDEAIKKQQSQAKEVNEPKKNLDALEIIKSQWKVN
jgi:Uncharacterized protein conserved in bacteria